jgi:hypothetical protein
MRSFNRTTLFALTAAICIPCIAAHAQDKKKAPKKPGSESKTPAKTPAEPPKKGVAGLADLPIPKGSPQKEIRFPLYNSEGKKTTYYRIGLATWRDDENIDMKEMELQTFDADEKLDSTVKLPDAALNVPTETITALANVYIKDERFEITAKSLSYNMAAKNDKGEKDSEATLGGGVKMTIFNTDSLVGSTKKSDGPEIKIEPLKEEPTKK